MRAVSEVERLRLCALWKGEHSYQGWSIMLGCDGRKPAETEPLCTNVGALVRLRLTLTLTLTLALTLTLTLTR